MQLDLFWKQANLFLKGFRLFLVEWVLNCKPIVSSLIRRRDAERGAVEEQDEEGITQTAAEKDGGGAGG